MLPLAKIPFHENEHMIMLYSVKHMPQITDDLRIRSYGLT